MIVILFLLILFVFVSRFNDPHRKLGKSETAEENPQQPGNIVGTTARAPYNLFVNVSISFWTHKFIPVKYP